MIRPSVIVSLLIACAAFASTARADRGLTALGRVRPIGPGPTLSAALASITALMLEAGLATEGTTVLLSTSAAAVEATSLSEEVFGSAGVEFIVEAAAATDHVNWLRDVVAGDPRVLTIPAENRTITVKADGTITVV